MKDLNAFDIKEATKYLWLSKINGNRGQRIIMKKISKRYKELLKPISGKKLNIKEALDLVKKNSNAKVDELIDISLKINLKQSKGDDFI